MIFKQFTQNQLQKDKKTLGFSVRPAWESADAENLVNPVEIWRFWRPRRGGEPFIGHNE